MTERTLTTDPVTYQIPARMPYNGRMDRECIALCNALNGLPGITTYESCCGHGERPFWIFFFASNIAALGPIHRALEHNWQIIVTHLDCPYRVTFLLEGPSDPKAGDELAEYVHD